MAEKKKCWCWRRRRRMCPINLVNGAFHLHIMYKVELDWPRSARTDWVKQEKLH